MEEYREMNEKQVSRVAEKGGNRVGNQGRARLKNSGYNSQRGKRK